MAARSTALAHAVRDAMTAVEPVSNYLGAQGLDPRGDLAGLNLSAVPAIYVECGNMRNADGRRADVERGRPGGAGPPAGRGDPGLPRPLRRRLSS